MFTIEDSSISRRITLRIAGCLCCAAVLPDIVPTFAAGSPRQKLQLPLEVAGIRIPDSKAARDAAELAYSESPPFLFNHGMRVFAFGSVHARNNGWERDEEAAFVAAALHDLGLLPPYDDPAKTFEAAGADCAKTFALERGLSESRSETVRLAIARHTTPGASRGRTDAVAIIQIGAGHDVGFGCIAMTHSDRDAILNAFPRLGFRQAFRNSLEEYSKRHPEGAGENKWVNGFLAGPDPGPCIMD